MVIEVVMRSVKDRRRRQDPAKLAVDEVEDRAAAVPVSGAGRAGDFSQLLALPPHQTSGRDVALAGLQQLTHSGRGNPTSVLGIAVAPRKRPNRPVDRAQQSGATSRYPLQELQ